MCYLFPIWHPDIGMYVRITLLTLMCYSWWEEKQAWGLFAPNPELGSSLVIQVWTLGASYSSQQAGMLMSYYFLMFVPLGEHLFTESAFTCLFCPLHFSPPFCPSGESLQSTVMHSVCHFHEQGRSSICRFTSYSCSLKCTCRHKNMSKLTQDLLQNLLLKAVDYSSLR